MGVGQVGCDDFQEPAAEDLERLRVVLAGCATRCSSARMIRSGSRSSGRARTARMITRPARAAGHRRRGRPGPGRRCPGRSRSRTTPEAAPRVCRVRCASQFAVDVAPTSVPTWTSSACAATRASSSTIWDFKPGELDQGRRRFGGAHGPHGCVDHTVRNRAHVRGRRSHLVVGCGHRGHGSTQALTTDSQRPRSRLSTGVQVTNRSRSSCRWKVVSRLGPGGPRTSTTGREAGGGPQPPPAVPGVAACRRPTRTDPKAALIAPSSLGSAAGYGKRSPSSDESTKSVAACSKVEPWRSIACLPPSTGRNVTDVVCCEGVDHGLGALRVSDPVRGAVHDQDVTAGQVSTVGRVDPGVERHHAAHAIQSAGEQRRTAAERVADEPDRQVAVLLPHLGERPGDVGDRRVGGVPAPMGVEQPEHRHAALPRPRDPARDRHHPQHRQLGRVHLAATGARRSPCSTRTTASGRSGAYVVIRRAVDTRTVLPGDPSADVSHGTRGRPHLYARHVPRPARLPLPDRVAARLRARAAEARRDQAQHRHQQAGRRRIQDAPDRWRLRHRPDPDAGGTGRPADGGRRHLAPPAGLGRRRREGAHPRGAARLPAQRARSLPARRGRRRVRRARHGRACRTGRWSATAGTAHLGAGDRVGTHAAGRRDRRTRRRALWPLRPGPGAPRRPAGRVGRRSRRHPRHRGVGCSASQRTTDGRLDCEPRTGRRPGRGRRAHPRRDLDGPGVRRRGARSRPRSRREGRLRHRAARAHGDGREVRAVDRAPARQRRGHLGTGPGSR